MSLVLSSRGASLPYIVVLLFILYCRRTSSIDGAAGLGVSLSVFRHLRGRTVLTLVGRGARGSAREHEEQVQDCRKRGACRMDDGNDIVGVGNGEQWPWRPSPLSFLDESGLSDADWLTRGGGAPAFWDFSGTLFVLRRHLLGFGTSLYFLAQL